jgi:hypothetical protein
VWLCTYRACVLHTTFTGRMCASPGLDSVVNYCRPEKLARRHASHSLQCCCYAILRRCGLSCARYGLGCCQYTAVALLACLHVSACPSAHHPLPWHLCIESPLSLDCRSPIDCLTNLIYLPARSTLATDSYPSPTGPIVWPIFI